MSEPEYVVAKDLCKMFCVSRRTFDEQTRHLPGFPPPIRLSKRTIRWELEQVKAWRAAQTKAA